MPEIRVVVGLGNPGSRYARTRHNIGFRLLDVLAREMKAGPERVEVEYRVAWAVDREMRVALLRPTTMMNRSGDALLRFPESVAAGPLGHLVVLDDAALPFGAIRFRARGSAGGHRGLESVLDRLGTEEVPRLRLGVGGAPEGRDLREYVLEPFAPDEEAAIGPWLGAAAEGVRTFLSDGPETAMNRFNVPRTT